MGCSEREKVMGLFSAFAVCAGYLNCIFQQGQLGRPLAPQEVATFSEDAQRKVIEIVTRVNQSDSHS